MKISLKAAEAILKEAKAKAIEIQVPMCIAVVDDGGYLKTFLRMDGAYLGSIDVALKKAKTAILFNMNSEALWEHCKPGAPAEGLPATNDVLVTFAGGIPLKDAQDELIGAIGVSGGSVEQDYAVAVAGVSAIKKLGET